MNYLKLSRSGLTASHEKVWEEPFAQEVKQFWEEWMSDSPTVTVQSSGSTGKPKVMQVEKVRMQASARATCKALSLQPGDSALLPMSVRYIGGKMMVVRALEWGLTLYIVAPSSRPLKAFSMPVSFTAMVPMQVARSVESATERERLHAIETIIIGGAAIPPPLKKEIEQHSGAVYATYGMTETLSHIALRRLNGPAASLAYTPMPGVSITLSERDAITIEAPEIVSQTLLTNDRGRLLDDGRFLVLGRLDNVVNSGGIKIQIEEVEALFSTLLPPDLPFAFSAAADPILGEKLVLLVASPTLPHPNLWVSAPKYFQPKEIISVDCIPKTANGKIDRQGCRTIIKTHLHN